MSIGRTSCLELETLKTSGTMIQFVTLSLFCLTVSGVASNFAADPYRIEASKQLLQNTQLVEGVYSEGAKAGKTVQALPCQRQSQSGASQVDAHPDQNDNLAQNKESPYGNSKSNQNQKLRARSNYGNNFNPKNEYHDEAKVAQFTSSKHGSGYQYNNPHSEYKNLPNVVNAPNPVNSAVDQYNVENAQSVPKESTAKESSFVIPSNNANAANLARAVNTQPKRLKQNSQVENYPPHFINPVVHYDLAKAFSSVDAHNHFQSQIQGPVAAQLTSASLVKNKQSPSERRGYYNEDQDYYTLVDYSGYDSNRRTNKRQDHLSSHSEGCQKTKNDVFDNEPDLDTRREQDLYRFINEKLFEENVESSGTDHKTNNKNKEYNHEHVNSETTDYEDDQAHHDEFEAYNRPSKKKEYFKKTEANYFEGKKPVTDYGNDDILSQSANTKEKYNIKGTKTQNYPAKQNQVNKFEVHDQVENHDYGVQTDIGNKYEKQKHSQANTNHISKNSLTGKHNENSAHSRAKQDDGDDEQNPDEYHSEVDYLEDYNVDLSEPHRRHSYNQQQGQTDPKTDCESQELENRRSNNQNNESPEVEEVDVTGRSGHRQKVLVGQHTRVCYACSSASNPTCLNPNKQTTVKYCQRGHDACVTKVFKANGIDILTRDCGTSCNDNLIPGLTPKYKECSVCHTDLCNGAFSLTSQNIFFISALAVVSVTKFFI